MRWFRLYWSMVDSVKVGSLDDAGFRTYVELLCLAGQKQDRGLTGVTETDVSWRLRRNVTETLPSLLQKQLVTISRNGELTVPDWDERQMKSDSSSERVAKFRNKNNEGKKETLQKRRGNGLDKSRGDIDISGFAEFWAAWPKHFRKQSRGSCETVWVKKGLAGQREAILAHVESLKSSDQWRDVKFIPAPLVYLNQGRWDGAEVPSPSERKVGGL